MLTSNCTKKQVHLEEEEEAELRMREGVDHFGNPPKFYYTLHDQFTFERGVFPLLLLMERNRHHCWFAGRAALPGELGPHK